MPSVDDSRWLEFLPFRLEPVREPLLPKVEPGSTETPGIAVAHAQPPPASANAWCRGPRHATGTVQFVKTSDAAFERRAQQRRSASPARIIIGAMTITSSRRAAS